MEVVAFEQEVRRVLDQARDALGRIEMHVRETDFDDPALMATSKALAQFCMHAREYVTGSTLGRPLPHKFADQLGSVRDALTPHGAVAKTLDVHPTAQEVEALAALGRALPARIRGDAGHKAERF